MALTKEKKEKIVADVADAVKSAQSVVFVNFRGLRAGETLALRKELKKQGGHYTVVKKSLMKRVLGALPIEGTLPEFPGEVAIAYADDMVSPAKSIAMFGKKLKDSISAVGGILESRYISAAEVKALAAIPGRTVLYGQLVTVLNAPIQNTVGVLNNVVRSFVVALDQIAQAKN